MLPWAAIFRASGFDPRRGVFLINDRGGFDPQRGVFFKLMVQYIGLIPAVGSVEYIIRVHHASIV